MIWLPRLRQPHCRPNRPRIDFKLYHYPLFSKKLESHEPAIALHYMFYNFARIHQNLRITPAIAAGVSDHVWSVDEVIALLDDK